MAASTCDRHRLQSLHIEHAANDAGVGDLGVADDPGFVEFFRSHHFGSGGKFLVRKLAPITAMGGNFLSLLSRIVFIGEAALGTGLDLERVRLRPIRGGD